MAACRPAGLGAGAHVVAHLRARLLLPPTRSARRAPPPNPPPPVRLPTWGTLPPADRCCCRCHLSIAAAALAPQNAENEMAIIAAYYGLPTLSVRAAVFHQMLRNQKGYQVRFEGVQG